MKVKILATLLTVSVLFNVAGLVFFIKYIRLQHHYKSLVRERDLLAMSVKATSIENQASNAVNSKEVEKRSFVSQVDGQQDYYALMPPRNVAPQGHTLVVYLHGMGSNFLEPFLTPRGTTINQAIAERFPDICLLSCSYRKHASWGSELALSDITQNIRDVEQQYKINKIIVMGTSMGGCTALSYATAAPSDIKEKIKGIVSVEGAGDLHELFELSRNADVKLALANALGGPYEQVPENWRRRSFLPNISSLPPDVRVAVISARQDSIVPPKLQDEVVQALEHEQKPVKLINVDSDHGAPPAPIYIEGLDFALGNG